MQWREELSCEECDGVKPGVNQPSISDVSVMSSHCLVRKHNSLCVQCSSAWTEFNLMPVNITTPLSNFIAKCWSSWLLKLLKLVSMQTLLCDSCSDDCYNYHLITVIKLDSYLMLSGCSSPLLLQTHGTWFCQDWSRIFFCFSLMWLTTRATTARTVSFPFWPELNFGSFSLILIWIF